MVKSSEIGKLEPPPSDYLITRVTKEWAFLSIDESSSLSEFRILSYILARVACFLTLCKS